MICRHRAVGAMVVCVAVWLLAATPLAAKTLEEELDRIVGLIKTKVPSGQQVRVEPLANGTVNSELSASLKTGLTEALADELKRQGVATGRKANFLISGKFFVTDDQSLQAGEPLEVTLHCELSKGNGQIVIQFASTRLDVGNDRIRPAGKVDDPAFLAQAVGAVGQFTTANLPTKLTSQAVAQLAGKPTGRADGTRVRSAPDSPYAVEVYTRAAGSNADFAPLAPTTDGGVPYVDIPKGHEYKILIYNESGAPVAVAPSIDGLSTFHFADRACRDPQTGRLACRHYTIPAFDDIGRPYVAEISGWHLSSTGDDNVARFLVTSYGEGAAHSVGVPVGLDSGAIHLQFCRCVPANSGAGTRSIDSSPKGTTLGERETVQFKQSKFAPGAPLEFLTIRYDR